MKGPAVAYARENSLDSLDEKELARLERRFLWKLDVCLITWAWLAYLIKLIDSSNYKTAYASGMKEDMNFYGNQLNYLDTFYRIGYALFLIPSQLVLTKVRASYWLPPLELAWGLMTGLMAAVPSVKGRYVLRFFIGVFEASSYPGIISILCNWYTPSELATRIAIFGTSYPASSMFVSFMQVSIQETLDGRHGVPGWKWLFVFNAIMTVVVAAAGFFLIPDAPGRSKVFWMSSNDDLIARSRMDRVKKLPATRLSRSIVKKTFTSWTIYVFTFAYALWSWTQNSNTWIILFLKAAKNSDGSKRFTIAELNAIPIGGYALQLLAMLLFAWLSSKTGWRATWIWAQMCLTAIGLIVLCAWPASFGVKMVGYFLLWTSNAAGPILIAWMADWCPAPEERAIIVGVCVTLVYVIDAFANIFIYPAKQAPHYKIGYHAALAFCLSSMIMTGVFQLFVIREERKRQAAELRDREEEQAREEAIEDLEGKVDRDLRPEPIYSLEK